MPALDVRLTSYPIGFDPLHLDLETDQGTGVGPIFNFYAPPLSQLAFGNFSAVTARAGNIPNEVTDGVVSTVGQEGMRLRIPSGARAGASSWVALSTGAGKRRTGEWLIADPINFSTPMVPQVGDPYVLEAAVGSLALDYIRVRSGGNENYPTYPQVNFWNFDFSTPTAGASILSNDGGAALGFLNCSFGAGSATITVLTTPGAFGIGGYTYMPNCFCNQVMNFCRGGYGENYIEAGVWAAVQAMHGGGVSVDLDALGQRNGPIHAVWAALLGGTMVIHSAGSMDAHGSSDGAPFIVADNGLIILAEVSLYGLTEGRMWGSSADANTYGLSIRDGGCVRYADGTRLTATGLAGDWRIGSQQTAYGFDTALGLYTAPIATTWANLRTTLLDNAHYPPTRSSICKSSALMIPR